MRTSRTDGMFALSQWHLEPKVREREDGDLHHPVLPSYQKQSFAFIEGQVSNSHQMDTVNAVYPSSNSRDQLCNFANGMTLCNRRVLNFES